MAVDRVAPATSVIDVLDHVLDKGIVIDAWVRVSLVGIDLLTVEARVVVASIHTYLAFGNAVARMAPSSAGIPAAPRPGTLEDQLHRVRDTMMLHDAEPHVRRRSEDKVRDKRHDSRATVVTRSPRHA